MAKDFKMGTTHDIDGTPLYCMEFFEDGVKYNVDFFTKDELKGLSALINEFLAEEA